MKSIMKFSLLLALMLLLVACNNQEIAPLAVAGQPTLVYVYTEA